KKKARNAVAQSAPQPAKMKQKTDLESLKAIIRDKQTSSEKLQETLDLVIKYHGTIHQKLGTRTHPDFDNYVEIIFMICLHPNTSKDIIVKFDRELEKLNPNYVAEINDSLTKGLNSRGI
ncbi:hypothetical protein KKG72_06175, partial [bacterium]|nr:hypothetical protein [bacterium]MBU1994280.1 hypothetical protein [bacterium]